MTYLQYRKALIRAFYENQLGVFLNHFDPTKKTIFLLPGGMASDLMRTALPHPCDGPSNPFVSQLWLGYPDVLSKAASDLQMSGSRDKDEFVVAADGAINFLGYKPYDEFIKFADNKWNLFVFAFDWRRPIKESSDTLIWLLKEFSRRANRIFRKDPLPDLTLLSHSMGGIVIAYALHHGAFTKLPFAGCMTVAAPFYGSSSQQTRYYMGQPPLNSIYGKTSEAIVNILATFPGPYSLMFLPKPVFERYGRLINLNRYPVRDRQTGADSDPYDPRMSSRWVRSVNRQYIRQNRDVQLQVASPLGDLAANRFFNVRSAVKDFNETPVEFLWDDLDGSDYEFGDYNPLTPALGSGDGAIPYWSAIHASTPRSNRWDLTDAREHYALFEHPELLNLIDAFMVNHRFPKTIAMLRRRATRVASLVEVKPAIEEATRARKEKRAITGRILELKVKRAILRAVMS